MKYFSYGLDNAMLNGKQTEKEIMQNLDIAQNVIESAKFSIKNISNSNSNELFLKVSN